MRTLITLATGVGGHFLNGNRRKGYGFFLILLIWSIVFFLCQVALLAAGLEQAVNPIGTAAVFAVGFVAIWATSAKQAMSGARSTVRAMPTDPIRVSELALVSVATLIVALYGLVAFVLVPQMQPGERIELFSISSKRSSNVQRTLPTADGDLLLAGEVRQDGHAVANAPFVFLFQDGFRTREIKTDALGQFQYRLPPGDWRFLGPVFVENKAQPVTVVFSREIQSATPPTFQVHAGAAERKVTLRIALGRVEPNDL